jgi:probable dihydroxyacetone kinase regulator
MSDSLITKKAIAAGMKELTRKKSFDKITVSDIAEICGLNRQTFYYHFQDKFELVDWIYYNEAIAIIVNELNYDNWDSKIKQFLTRLKAEDYFYISTLKAPVENEFREYLFKVTLEFLCNIIRGITVNSKASEEDIRFVAEFYTYGIVGIVISWVQRGMKETPEYITAQLKNLVYGTEKYATLRYQSRNSNKNNDKSLEKN